MSCGHAPCAATLAGITSTAPTTATAWPAASAAATPGPPTAPTGAPKCCPVRSPGCPHECELPDPGGPPPACGGRWVIGPAVAAASEARRSTGCAGAQAASLPEGAVLASLGRES